MKPATFVSDLASLRFKNSFNPYADVCSEFDSEDAPAIRRKNLELVLSAAIDRGIDSFWIARDLGYRGGRRTGLALTDEIHLPMHAGLLGTAPLRRATKGSPVGERTATVVWRMLQAIEQPIFLWNVFPFHPHLQGNPLTNRCHTRAERRACQPILDALIKALRPKHIIAIGRDAQSALLDLGVQSRAVRHHSYGGQTEFVEGLKSIYKISSAVTCDKQLHLI